MKKEQKTDCVLMHCEYVTLGSKRIGCERIRQQCGTGSRRYSDRPDTTPGNRSGTSEAEADTAEAASGNETTDDTVTSEEESVVTENPDTPENATGERDVVSVDEKGNVFTVDDEMMELSMMRLKPMQGHLLSKQSTSVQIRREMQ